MPTEHEMKEFFQTVVDQVATLSSQAARVEGLEQRVDQLVQQVNELSSQNQQLRQDLDQAHGEISSVKGKLTDAQHILDNERAVINGLRDTLVGRDSKVQELEANNQNERDAHRITLSERDDARRVVQEQEGQLNSFRSELETTRRERDTWETQARAHENAANVLKQQLDKISAVITPLRVVQSQDVA
jgi:chromosome segregation ATPase